MEAAHVQQRILADQRSEQLGILRQHDAHQQAPRAAAHRAELRGGRDARSDQILSDGGEALGDFMSVFADGLLVPGRPELAAAADIRHREAATRASHSRPSTPSYPGMFASPKLP